MTGCKGVELSTNDYAEPAGGFVQFNPPESGEEIAVITTNFGIIKARLFQEYAPKAVLNFKELAKSGYYDGVIFHRIMKDFMIQGGDPDGTGLGGESFFGEDFEVESSPQLHHINGALSMARTSLPVSQGSQFFIVQNEEVDSTIKTFVEQMLNDMDKSYVEYMGEKFDVKTYAGKSLKIKEWFPKAFLESYLKNGGVPHLDACFPASQDYLGYSVFGQVFEGLDIVVDIGSTPTDTNNKPLENVVIESIKIEIYE